MFPKSNWLERRLPDIGLWMFLVGLGLLIFGMIGEAFFYAGAYGGANTEPPSKLWPAFWQVVRGLASPFIYNGVVLYLVGRLVGAWTVSIVGFEHSDSDALRVKGPDGANAVWIGRKYATVLDAEAAAAALALRFEAR
jgi:hypothetical protein